MRPSGFFYDYIASSKGRIHFVPFLLFLMMANAVISSLG
ncbi:hypothetical protein SD78_2651 [Bacillus badius]|nr:hypothetical protein SD78_2651 [Bacillus badius]